MGFSSQARPEPFGYAQDKLRRRSTKRSDSSKSEIRNFEIRNKRQHNKPKIAEILKPKSSLDSFGIFVFLII